MFRRSFITVMIGLVISGCTPLSDIPPQGALAEPTAELSAWRLYEPAATGPMLFEPADAGFQLRSDWQIARLDYDYHYSTLGGETQVQHTISQTPSGYQRDGVAVDEADISAFLRSLTNLDPVQAPLEYLAWTDDYPRRTITLTANDGQRITITSTSTGNPLGAPWNIEAGGQRFAQYDGRLTEPLLKLIGDTPDVWPRSASGPINLATLAPPATPNTYESATSAAGVSLSYKAVPSAIIGTVNLHPFTGTLTMIDLKKPDESSAPCLVTAPSGAMPTQADWSAYDLTCPVPEAVGGERYTYALFLHVADQPPIIIRLTGTWGQAYDATLLPPPLAWRAATANSVALRDLLSDHVLLRLNYAALIEPANIAAASLSGAAVLLGQTEFAGRTVRYSVETAFVITNGALTYWELERPGLETLRDDVLRLPLTQRVLAADPQAIINLRYTAKPFSAVPVGFNQSGLSPGRPPEEQVEILPCGTIPGGSFPSATHALRGFSFNQPLNDWAPNVEFVLIDATPIVANLDLIGPNNTSRVFRAMFKGAAYAALVPEGLGGAEPFADIWQATNPGWLGHAKPTLGIRKPGPDERIKALNLPFTATYDGWEAEGVTIRVDADGVLRLAECN